MKGISWKDRVRCGEVGPGHAGREVSLVGWVDAVRDHGGILFIHLRDVAGVVQVLFDPSAGVELMEGATALREEEVVAVRGMVGFRPPETVNPNLRTGLLEVRAIWLEKLAGSRPLPFPISEKAMICGEEAKTLPGVVDEDLRLRYRYLDLRRPSVQQRFVERSRILKAMRDHLYDRGFLEIETPVLTRSTPEGARDYLVPSRVHKGRFYALPQSPQLFKQLLMVGGMDRYFQVARCFRDEDLRPNRQPEFTQLDMEASFVDEEFFYALIEGLMEAIAPFTGVSLSTPFPRMPYQEALARYGTDRPDLRYALAFEEVTGLFQRTRYGIFRKVIEEGGVIKGLCVRGKAEALSKNTLQNEIAQRIVPSFGGKGLTWMKVIEGRLQSNIVQFFGEEEQRDLMARFSLEEGDVLLLVADTSRDLLHEVLFKLREHLAGRLGLIAPGVFCPVWITDFPLFEWSEGRLYAQHHPFTMPDTEDLDPSDLPRLRALGSRAYDLVLNGEEMGGGSVRIHDPRLQRRVFQALGLSEEEIEEKFGFFLTALSYGTPPHAGIALGLDRMLSLLLGTPSIRDVIAFPKNRSAFCPLTHAPAAVGREQLEELGIGGRPGEGASPDASEKAKAPGGTCRPGPLSGGDLRHVARLARLQLGPEDLEAYGQDLNRLLGHMASIQEIDTEGISPMAHVLSLHTTGREDLVEAPWDPEALLAHAPEREGDFFRVPRILEA